jgi:hypothetical protein
LYPFRTFLAPNNAFGFAAGDLLELALAVLAALFLLASPRLQSWAANLKPVEGLQRFARQTGWCMLALFILPIVLRLALLPRSPIPTPSGADDFGYLLLSDTLLHGRLANPSHSLPQFFETNFVIQEPTYSSMFSLGQGFALAFGSLLFGNSWAGVLMSIGLFCSLCYWMLRAWASPVWALTGGILAACMFGPLCYWTNCYWGGAVSASAGCLVFGALPRLRSQHSVRNGALLGIGLSAQLLTRPFESIFLVLSAILYWVVKYRFWRKQLPSLAATALLVAPAALLILLQNKAVTDAWTETPYMLYRYQYGVPATFTFQRNPIPHRALASDQELDYRAETLVHGEGPETLQKYFGRLAFRLRFLRFFLWAPLYLVLPFFLLACISRKPSAETSVCATSSLGFGWVVLTLAIFALGSNFFPYFYPHYIAAVTCLLLLVAVTGLQQLSALRIGNRHPGPALAYLVLLLCAAHFIFWYGMHAFAGDATLTATGKYEAWDFINYGDPEHRIAINRALAQTTGEQLVFVRYGPRHGFHQWIHNAADIDTSRIVWARDLGSSENEKLLEHYKTRKAWLLEPDAWEPRLVPYHSTVKAFESVP